nr:transposase [Sphingobium sp. TCM1]
MYQGQRQGGCRSQGSKAGRSRHPDVRLQKSHRYRQTHGLIRTWDASAANAHDGARLPVLISKDNTASGVWADTAYRSKKNEAFLARGMFTSNIHRKRLPRRPLPERIARANARRSKVRAAVEHVFAGQKHRMGLVVRTIGIARARIKIGMANLVYNFQRLAWLEGRTAPV